MCQDAYLLSTAWMHGSWPADITGVRIFCWVNDNKIYIMIFAGINVLLKILKELSHSTWSNQHRPISLQSVSSAFLHSYPKEFRLLYGKTEPILVRSNTHTHTHTLCNKQHDLCRLLLQQLVITAKYNFKPTGTDKKMTTVNLSFCVWIYQSIRSLPFCSSVSWACLTMAHCLDRALNRFSISTSWFKWLSFDLFCNTSFCSCGRGTVKADREMSALCREKKLQLFGYCLTNRNV